MGRLLVSGADGNVRRHLVNALAANGHRRRGGDIRHPMRERSPARLMSHAAPGHQSITAGYVGAGTMAFAFKDSAIAPAARLGLSDLQRAATDDAVRAARASQRG